MTFARLRAWDWVAFLAALALLFVTSVDWYSTKQGEEYRRQEQRAQPQGALGGEIPRQLKEQARIAAESQEKNAWQVDGGIDRVILVALLLTAALGVLAGFAAASGRPSRSAIPPAGLAGLAAAASALLVLYRIFQKPGFDASATVKLGPLLALVVLGVLALASASSLRSEEKAPA